MQLIMKGPGWNGYRGFAADSTHIITRVDYWPSDTEEVKCNLRQMNIDQ